MKTEGIGNKVFLIAILCIAFAFYLFLAPRLNAPTPKPSLMDRLPKSTMIGSCALLDLTEEVNALVFENNLPFRDFITSDFILSQTKNFGLDIKRSSYFFSNLKNEIGIIAHLTDSSFVRTGLKRLEDFSKMKDTTVFNQKVKILRKQGVYIYYNDKYILMYKGKQFAQRFVRFYFAKKDMIEPEWEAFQKQEKFKGANLKAYYCGNDLKEFGLKSILFAYHNDSTDIRVDSYLQSKYDMGLSLKSLTLGPKLNEKNNFINMHLNIDGFKNNKKAPLYVYLSKKAKRFGFPLESFFSCWSGDLCYQEGGTQLVNEEYIEIGTDEEFNPIEIKRVKQVPVKGYSVFMGTNKASRDFINRLFAKGIITQQGGKYHFLFSPPLNLMTTEKYISVSTSKFDAPKENNPQFKVNWLWYEIPAILNVTEINSNDATGQITASGRKVIQKLLRAAGLKH